MFTYKKAREVRRRTHRKSDIVKTLELNVLKNRKVTNQPRVWLMKWEKKKLSTSDNDSSKCKQTFEKYLKKESNTKCFIEDSARILKQSFKAKPAQQFSRTQKKLLFIFLLSSFRNHYR